MKIKDAFEGYLAYRKGMGMDPKTIVNDTKMLYGSFSHSIAERELVVPHADRCRRSDRGGQESRGVRPAAVGLNAPEVLPLSRRLGPGNALRLARHRGAACAEEDQ